MVEMKWRNNHWNVDDAAVDDAQAEMHCAQVIEHWTFSLFFCIAELWGSVVISVLFWTLANDVCTVADAKIIYPSLGELPLCSATLAGLPAVLYTWLTCKPGTQIPQIFEAFMRLVASEVLASRTSETTIAKEGWSSWTRQMLILRTRPGMAKTMCCPLTFQSGHHSIVMQASPPTSRWWWRAAT